MGVLKTSRILQELERGERIRTVACLTRFPSNTWILRINAMNFANTPRSFADFSLKEVIQPHLPVRLPCYDFAPVTSLTLTSSLPKVGPLDLGTTDFHGVTGGVYKTRERIHRSVLIHDY